MSLLAPCKSVCRLLQIYPHCLDLQTSNMHHYRPRLKGLHYEYARHLESCGDLAAAAAQYEAAGAAAEEVPRMMLAAGREGDLERCGAWCWCTHL